VFKKAVESCAAYKGPVGQPQIQSICKWLS